MNTNTAISSCREDCTLPNREIQFASPLKVYACNTINYTAKFLNKGNTGLAIFEIIANNEAIIVDNINYPLLIPPNGSVALDLILSRGVTDIKTISSATNEPVQVSSVHVNQIHPVDLIIERPYDSEIIKEDEDIDVLISVSSAGENIESLVLNVTNKNGDQIARLRPSPDGVAGFIWLAVDREPGPQSIHINVVNTCGYITTKKIEFCQDKTTSKVGAWFIDDNSTPLKDMNFLGEIKSFTGESGGKKNVNYFSYSVHPRVGPSPVSNAMAIFLYKNNDGDYFVFYANKDKGGRSSSNRLKIDINIKGNNNSESVVLSDDPLELRILSRTSEESRYIGRFTYKRNSDGGVIGPLLGDKYKLFVHILRADNVNSITLHSADSSGFSILQNGGFIPFAIASYRSSSCHP